MTAAAHKPATLEGKVIVDRQQFVTALNRLAPLVARHKSLPVLRSVRLRTVDDDLVCSATDLELTAEYTIPGEGDIDVAIDLKTLRDITRWAAGPITITVDNDETTFAWGRTTAQLRCTPLDELPAAVDLGDHQTVTLTAGDVDNLRRVAGFASTDDARPILIAVQIASGTFAATDSYRLAVAEHQHHLDGPTLLPARATSFLPMRLLDNETVELHIAANRIRFVADGLTITTVLVDGEFPNWRGLVPANGASPNKVTVSREGAIGAVRQAACICNDVTPVRLGVDGATLTVRGVQQDVGQVAVDINASVTGTPPPVAFNPTYLVAALEALRSDTVTLQITDALKPTAMFDQGLTVVLMPVRIS